MEEDSLDLLVTEEELSEFPEPDFLNTPSPEPKQPFVDDLTDRIPKYNSPTTVCVKHHSVLCKVCSVVRLEHSKHRRTVATDNTEKVDSQENCGESKLIKCPSCQCCTCERESKDKSSGIDAKVLEELIQRIVSTELNKFLPTPHSYPKPSSPVPSDSTVEVESISPESTESLIEHTNAPTIVPTPLSPIIPPTQQFPPPPLLQPRFTPTLLRPPFWQPQGVAGPVQGVPQSRRRNRVNNRIRRRRQQLNQLPPLAPFTNLPYNTFYTGI